MKYFLILMCATLSLSSMANDCSTYEAQIMGKVKNVTRSYDLCFYKVEVQSHNAHVFCPLSKEEIESEIVEFEAFNNTCPYKTGESFSGILVKGKDGVIFFD